MSHPVDVKRRRLTPTTAQAAPRNVTAAQPRSAANPTAPRPAQASLRPATNGTTDSDNDVEVIAVVDKEQRLEAHNQSLLMDPSKVCDLTADEFWECENFDRAKAGCCAFLGCQGKDCTNYLHWDVQRQVYNANGVQIEGDVNTWLAAFNAMPGKQLTYSRHFRCSGPCPEREPQRSVFELGYSFVCCSAGPSHYEFSDVRTMLLDLQLFLVSSSDVLKTFMVAYTAKASVQELLLLVFGEGLAALSIAGLSDSTERRLRACQFKDSLSLLDHPSAKFAYLHLLCSSAIEVIYQNEDPIEPRLSHSNRSSHISKWNSGPHRLFYSYWERVMTTDRIHAVRPGAMLLCEGTTNIENGSVNSKKTSLAGMRFLMKYLKWALQEASEPWAQVSAEGKPSRIVVLVAWQDEKAETAKILEALGLDLIKSVDDLWNPNGCCLITQDVMEGNIKNHTDMFGLAQSSPYWLLDLQLLEWAMRNGQGHSEGYDRDTVEEILRETMQAKAILMLDETSHRYHYKHRTRRNLLDYLHSVYSVGRFHFKEQWPSTYWGLLGIESPSPPLILGCVRVPYVSCFAVKAVLKDMQRLYGPSEKQVKLEGAAVLPKLLILNQDNAEGMKRWL